MTQAEEIIMTFQANGGHMTLGEMGAYSWFYEFRARKTEINHEDPKFQLRLAKRGKSPSQNLYVLEPKPRPGELI